MRRRQREWGDGGSNLAEEYLEITRRNLPVVNRALEEQGNVPLLSYVRGLMHEQKTSYQARDDLFDVLQRQAGPLLGNKVAKQAARDLEAQPIVLTANHHGVDSLAQTFQGNIIFSLNTLTGEAITGKTVPVCSCGSIPLNNLEYPRGLLLYHLDSQHESVTRKFPIFPDRFKRCMVSVMPGFDEAMLSRAELTLDQMLRHGKLTAPSTLSLRKLLREDYSSPSVVGRPSYSDQSVILNHRIWGRIFNKPLTAPAMVNLELERIVGALLNSDLVNERSLARLVMFDPQLRREVITELDGVRGCWQLEELAGRPARPGSPKTRSQGCGTTFFWGVDRTLRRIPLSLTDDGESLSGIDDRGDSFELPFTPAAIMEGIRSARLLPSLFTCFLTLSLARGVVCVGGFHQGEYLPAMQRGLVRALARTPGYGDLSPYVAQVPTDRYLSGMLVLMSRVAGDYLIPAGPVEVLAAGGITAEDMKQLSQISVREAHLAGLFETVTDSVPRSLRFPDWEKQLAKGCCTLLEGKVVIK